MSNNRFCIDGDDSHEISRTVHTFVQSAVGDTETALGE